MTGRASTPIDVMAILTDLQQQVSDLTGIVEAQHRNLTDLGRVVTSQQEALHRLLPGSPLLSAMTSDPPPEPGTAPNAVLNAGPDAGPAAVPAAVDGTGGV